MKINSKYLVLLFILIVIFSLYPKQSGFTLSFVSDNETNISMQPNKKCSCYGLEIDAKRGEIYTTHRKCVGLVFNCECYNETYSANDWTVENVLFECSNFN